MQKVLRGKMHGVSFNIVEDGQVELSQYNWTIIIHYNDLNVIFKAATEFYTNANQSAILPCP